MSEWWAYSPEDLLLFSSRVYYRLLALHNDALWPAHVVALVLGVAVVLAAVSARTSAVRIAVVLLGALWAWVSWSFLWERYATINWAVAYVVPVFAAQGIAVALCALRRERMAPVAMGWVRSAGIGLLAAAVLLYPLVAPWLGRPWGAAEVFGIAPDPTAVATLAFLALTRLSVWLMIVPAFWCALSSEILWLLGSPDFFIPAAGALAAIILRGLGTRQRSSA